VAGLTCKGVAGAGRAQVGVAFAAGREDDGWGVDASARRLDAAERPVLNPEGAGGCREAEADAQLAGAAEKGSLNVGGGVGGGIDVQTVGRGGRDTKRAQESAKGVGTEGGEGGLDEASVASEEGGKLVGGERAREVAPPAAGGEEFHARARKLLEKDDAATAFGGRDGSQEAGGAGADDGEVHGIGRVGIHGGYRNGMRAARQGNDK
jgi:hypothetical protein